MTKYRSVHSLESRNWCRMRYLFQSVAVPNALPFPRKVVPNALPFRLENTSKIHMDKPIVPNASPTPKSCLQIVLKQKTGQSPFCFKEINTVSSRPSMSTLPKRILHHKENNLIDVEVANSSDHQTRPRKAEPKKNAYAKTPQSGHASRKPSAINAHRPIFKLPTSHFELPQSRPDRGSSNGSLHGSFETNPQGFGRAKQTPR